jgi:hypothetical protein
MRTEVYQAKLWNKEFAIPLNAVILHKTNLTILAIAQDVPFSTNLDLRFDKLIDVYKLRFQIVFNFREA